MSIRSLLKLNKGFKIPLGSLKANYVQVSQNFIKSHLKFCQISQIAVRSLWHVCKTREIRANECLSQRQVRRYNRDIFSIFFNMKVCCVCSLESLQYTIFVIKQKITLDYLKYAAKGFFTRDSRMSLKTAVVNEPSVFKPLKFYCIFFSMKAFNIWCHSINQNPCLILTVFLLL